MLSRVQELEQLYILEQIPEDKIYANHRALAEIDRLLQVSVNQNRSDWDKEDEISKIKISFLNCRSMKNKFEHIRADKCLLKSDVIILTETWLEQTQTVNDQYKLDDYEENLNNMGRGRGIASYFKLNFKHTRNINYEGFSITKIENKSIISLVSTGHRKEK